MGLNKGPTALLFYSTTTSSDTQLVFYAWQTADLEIKYKLYAS